MQDFHVDDDDNDDDDDDGRKGCLLSFTIFICCKDMVPYLKTRAALKLSSPAVPSIEAFVDSSDFQAIFLVVSLSPVGEKNTFFFFRIVPGLKRKTNFQAGICSCRSSWFLNVSCPRRPLRTMRGPCSWSRGQ